MPTNVSGSNTGPNTSVTQNTSASLITAGVGGSGPRAATFVIAASNSLSTVGADYVCTGANDDQIINAAILALPPNGGKILFRAGTYNISAPIVIDRSWVDLEGENHPMWNSYLAPWNGINTNATVGDRGARINAVAGTDGFVLGNTNIPDQGESRHRGIRIAKFYITGTNYAGHGILSNTPHDFCCVEYNAIQRFNRGIDGSWDTVLINNNSIQDINGQGITGGGVNPRIVNNLIYDILGNAIVSTGSDCMIANNKIGDIASDAITVGGYATSIVGNQIGGVRGRAIVVGWSGCSITGNTIDYKSGPYGKANRTQGAIFLVSGTDGVHPYGCNAVVGNTLIADETGESAGVYAIDGGSTAGNVIVGNAMRGAWNNTASAAAAINAALTGGTNQIANNATS